jgi:hypothetical protein
MKPNSRLDNTVAVRRTKPFNQPQDPLLPQASVEQEERDAIK